MTPTLETNSTLFEIRQEYLEQYRFFEAQNKSRFTDAPPQPYALQALDPNHQLRNRYGDITPYQENIFRFQNPNLYFNASRVLQGRAISCQGPLDNEHAHFWRMVWESQTTAIIMLTDLVEKDLLKCSWYLPQGTGAELPPKYELPEGLEVTVTQVDGPPRPPAGYSLRGFTALVERRLELQYKGEKRTVVHYHLRGWGDFKTAPEVILTKLVMLVWERHFSKGEHILSHCSAGVGRSGTFLAILEAVSQLKKAPVSTDLVFNIVKHLRSFDHGREGMVQNVDQYGLIFKTLAILDTSCAQQFCLQASL
ncbi:MAG TPA: protein-tyrosine phosphatase family protein [Rhabdochlamydiaceae bacterium]